jgi:very-short-patch-repair endonuclease
MRIIRSVGERRKLYLQNYKKISEYESENLMYSVIVDILAADKYAHLSVVTHVSLNTLIRNTELLDKKEYRYVSNPATHLDFLIYNRISKKPVLAIEVDGYDYHKPGTVQNRHDIMKEHVMKVYGIELVRFKTNGSGEREKIEKMLDSIC